MSNSWSTPTPPSLTCNREKLSCSTAMSACILLTKRSSPQSHQQREYTDLGFNISVAHTIIYQSYTVCVPVFFPSIFTEKNGLANQSQTFWNSLDTNAEVAHIIHSRGELCSESRSNQFDFFHRLNRAQVWCESCFSEWTTEETANLFRNQSLKKSIQRWPFLRERCFWWVLGQSISLCY